MEVMSCDICETCQYGHIEEENKARIYVTCDLNEGKRWFFGQYICCEDKYKKRKEECDE